MKLKSFFALCLLLSLLCGCAKSTPTTESTQFFAMDTLMTLTATGENAAAALSAARERILSLEGKLSATSPESELYALNAAGSLSLSEDTVSLLERSLSLCELTGGNFDISISPAVAAWGFYTDEYRIPSEEELASLRQRIDYRRIAIDGSTVTLSEGQGIDLGAIAKGYASEECARILRSEGIGSALIVLGGSVQALGSKADGSPWRIAIQNPDGSDDYLGIWTGEDACLVTSGDYQRYFERDGVRYHHILDPRTAAPSRSDLRSVTVICADPVRADALSTALFVMGSERALEFRREQGDFELVLCTADGRILLSRGLEGSFHSDFPMEVVE